MSKAVIQKSKYENLVLEYVNFRNLAGGYLLKMAEVIAHAKSALGSKMFKKFLKDPQINLKRLQANKMIAIYEAAKSDSRLAHFFNKEGVEKSYLVTTIKDDEGRNQFIEAIEDDVFTVRQTKQAVKLISDNQKTPSEAVAAVKNLWALSRAVPSAKKTIPFKKYEALKADYESVLAEKLELEERLAELSQNKSAPAPLKLQENERQVSLFDKQDENVQALQSSIK